MVRKLVIFRPIGNQSSLYTDFVLSYERAKTYLMAHMDELPWNLEIVEYPCPTFPIDANRNECATRFIEGIPLDGKRVWRADISIWVDCDHTFSEDTFFRLLSHDKPIMLGIYFIKVGKRDNPFYPVIFKRREDKSNLFKAVMEWPEKDVFEVDFAGMGAACIRREVFEELERPYFKYSLHPENTAAPDAKWKNESDICDISEDRHFWDQVKDKTDYKILVDPQVMFGHIGKMVFDHYMYKGWLGEYKKRLIETHGQEKYKKLWGEMAIGEPYKEDKIVKKTG
jgi:hypothetical protein